LTVEVAVVDREGSAIEGLAPEKFEVEVAGRKRKVLSATFTTAAKPAADRRPAAYVVAIDALTFGQGSTKNVAEVVRSIVAGLPDDSAVGFATLPQGPAVEITTDRKAFETALGELSGQRQSAAQSGSFGLRASDAIEYLGAADRTTVVQNFCGATGEEDGCPSLLDQEVNVLVNGLETQARASLGMLNSITSRLEQVPGRKVLILVGGGLAVSERPGGRPDVGNVPATIADSAARGDIAVYAVVLDKRLLDPDPVGGRARQVASPAREAEVLGRWLDQFSTATGGALVRVQALANDPNAARIGRETRAYYVLSVESTPADKPGAIQRLRVRVDQRGATVRARQVVATR
jgi:VWFA-related protein